MPPARPPIDPLTDTAFEPDASPGPVPSPCINVCRIDPASGWCEGCTRTLDEIAAWSALSEAERRDLWRLLLARRKMGGAA